MQELYDQLAEGFVQDTGAPALLLDETIAQLTYVRRGQSPMLALESAVYWREDITTRLLDEIKLAPVDVQARYRTEPDARTAYYLHTFAFHLLGLFREPRAFHLMLDYFASDSDLADELSGDALNGHLPSLLVRCFDGSDARQLRLMIETEAFEPIFRHECLQAYHGLALTGRVDRRDVVALAERLLDAVPADATYNRWYVWLALAAAELQEPELRQRIEALFDRGLTSNGDDFFVVAEKGDIASIYAEKPAKIASAILHDGFYDNFVERVCRWYWFQKPRDTERDPIERMLGSVLLEQPYIRALPKVGRNEACPCGSGKKYKKCCLN